jgi:hypothetical protein
MTDEVTRIDGTVINQLKDLLFKTSHKSINTKEPIKFLTVNKNSKLVPDLVKLKIFRRKLGFEFVNYNSGSESQGCSQPDSKAEKMQG